MLPCIEGTTPSFLSWNTSDCSPRAAAMRTAQLEWQVFTAALHTFIAHIQEPRCWQADGKRIVLAAASLVTTLGVGVLLGATALNERLHVYLGALLPNTAVENTSIEVQQLQPTLAIPLSLVEQLRATVEQSFYFDLDLWQARKCAEQLKIIPPNAFSIARTLDNQYQCLLYATDTQQKPIFIDERGISCPGLVDEPVDDIESFGLLLVFALSTRYQPLYPIKTLAGLQHARKVTDVDSTVQAEVSWHLKRLVKYSSGPIYQILFNQNSNQLHVFTCHPHKADGKANKLQQLTDYLKHTTESTLTLQLANSHQSLTESKIPQEPLIQEHIFLWDPTRPLQGCHTATDDEHYFATFQALLEYQLFGDQPVNGYSTRAEIEEGCGEAAVMVFNLPNGEPPVSHKYRRKFATEHNLQRKACCLRVLSLLEASEYHAHLCLQPLTPGVPVSLNQMALAQHILGFKQPMTAKEAYQTKNELLALTKSPRSSMAASISTLQKEETTVAEDIGTVYDMIEAAYTVYDTYVRENLNHPVLIFDPHS